MDPQTLAIVITGIVSLGSAALGAGTTLVAGSRQHRLQVKKERADSIREREEKAAQECGSLCMQLAEYERKNRSYLEPHDEEARQARSAHMDSIRLQIQAALPYLPERLRENIKAALALMDHAEGIEKLGCHYDSPWSIIEIAEREVQSMVAAHLRDEVYIESEPRMREYRVALTEYYAEINSIYDDIDMDNAVSRERARERFYEDHPKVRPRQSEQGNS